MKRTPIKLKLRQNEIEYLLKLRVNKYKAKFDSEPTAENKKLLQTAQKEFDMFQAKVFSEK